MPSTPARRYVADVIERDGMFDVFLRDTKLERWVTMSNSASPEPTFALTPDEGPLLTVASDIGLLIGAAEAMGAVYKALGELSVMLLRRDLDAARDQPIPDDDEAPSIALRWDDGKPLPPLPDSAYPPDATPLAFKGE